MVYITFCLFDPENLSLVSVTATTNTFIKKVGIVEKVVIHRLCLGGDNDQGN